MKKLLFIFLIFILPNYYSFSQEADLKQLFLAAESYFLFEEFNEALPLYLRIHRQEPNNDNVNFKIGVCFLNDPYQKNKSITYLEKAVENINPKFKENNFKEKAAPMEALFYLGNAYRVNNQLEKAKDYYRLFLNRMDPDIYDAELVNEQIKACENAARLMKKPIDYDVTNLSDRINTRFADENPVVSGDETKMAFISKLQFYDAVFYTEKVNGEWAPPRNIVPELGVDGDVYPTSLSYNGTEMYIYRNDDFIGNLYISRLVNGKWTPLEKLNDNINTRFWESHASISRDGKTLYFSSNRKGGFGGLDIYRSERQANGDWGPAVNLGPKINTKYNDDTPFITESGEKIFFSSYGHFNMGGYDIFMSVKGKDNSWQTPVNIGYPINTTDDDQFFNPLQNGQVAYYSKYNLEGGFGKHDIFRFIVYSPDFPRMFSVSGFLKVPGDESKVDDINISVLKNNTSDTIRALNPDSDGNFEFLIPAGSYQMVFDGERFKRKILPLEVSKNTAMDGITFSQPITMELLPPALTTAELLRNLLTINEDSIIYAKPGEEVSINYSAAIGSTAGINVTNQDKNVFQDNLSVASENQTFTFMPEEGVNDVKITITDKDGNSVSRGLKVIVPVSPVEDIAGMGDSVSKDLELSQDIKTREPSTIEETLELLKKFAPGALLLYLNDLDPDDENISSLDELTAHLYSVSPGEDFTTDDIDQMLLDSGLYDDLDIFINRLAGVSSPALAAYLMGLDKEDHNIDSQEGLIDHLYSVANEQDFTTSDIDDALARYFAVEDMKKIIKELQNYSSGELQAYLSTLDPYESEIYSMDILIDNLLENSEEQGYTDQEVYRMLEDYFAAKPGYFLEILRGMKNNAEGQTLEYLQSVDENKVSSMNRIEFYDYILNPENSENFIQEEVISEALIQENIDPELTRKYLSLTGSEEVSQLLSQAEGESLSTTEIFTYMIGAARNNDDLDISEINNAFEQLLRNLDVYTDYFRFLDYSGEELSEAIAVNNIGELNFKDSSNMFEALMNKISDNNTLSGQFNDALSESYNMAYVKSILERLLQLSENGLYQALSDLDILDEDIRGLSDIIRYLLENTGEYGYSRQDVFDLIEKYLKGSFEIDITDEPEGQETDKDQEGKFSKGTKLTVGILLIQGLIILILILLARRKKKEKAKKKTE